MSKVVTAVLFFTINFLIFLLPKIMTGTISNDSVIFWAVWINSLFFLFLILPRRASYFFEEKNTLFGSSMLKLLDSSNKDYLLSTLSKNSNGEINAVDGDKNKFFNDLISMFDKLDSNLS